MPIFKTYNKDFFKKWTAEMAYVLGFLYADGNIMETKRGTHFTAFYSADGDLMKSIRDAIKSDHKISARRSESGVCYVLQIGSREWFDDLGKIGLIPNKTKRMRLPRVPKIFLGDFIRGYFDGDGSVWAGYTNKQRKKPTSLLMARFTSCSHGFLVDVLHAARKLGVKNGGVYRSKKGTYSVLTLSTLDALKLYEIMYNSSCSLFLERKKAIFEKFKNMRA